MKRNSNRQKWCNYGNCQEKRIPLGLLRQRNLSAIKLYRLDKGVGGKAEENMTVSMKDGQKSSQSLFFIPFIWFKTLRL